MSFPKRLRKQPSVIAVLVICLGALMLLWRPVLRGEVFLPIDALLHFHPWRYSYERVPVNNPINTDPIKQIYPRRVWTEATIRGGAWPLWNPTVLTGTPNLPDGQIGLFYPPTLLFLLVPLAQAFGYYAFFHVILAGLGAYAFARVLRLNMFAALLGGACYMLNGYLITWLYFPHHTGATALLPWCFWAVERALSWQDNHQDTKAQRTEKNLRALVSSWPIPAWVLAAVVCALPLLSHLQLALYIYLALGCYVLARTLQLGSWQLRLGALAGFAVAMCLALALGAVQLLPALELAAQGQRGSIGEDAVAPQDQFVNLLSLVLPAIGGSERVGPPPSWGPVLVRAPMPYVGVLPLLLAGVALGWSRRAASAFFGLLALVAFALAVGSPLVQLLQRLPFYSQFADQTRWFVLWYFAVSVLAALGVSVLTGDKERLPHAKPQRSRKDPDFFPLRLGGFARDVFGLSLPSDQLLLVKRIPVIGLALGVAVWALWHLQLFRPNSRYGEYITLIRAQSQLVSVAIITASVVLVGLLAWRGSRGFLHRSPTRNASTILASGFWLLAPAIALILFDLLWFGGSYNSSFDMAKLQPTSDLRAALAKYPETKPSLYPPTRQVSFLEHQPGVFRILGGDYTALAPNIASAYGLEDVRGYMSLYFERYNRLTRLVDGKDYRHTGEGAVNLRAYFSSSYNHRRLLDMLNVQYVLFEPGSKNQELFAPLELLDQSDEGTIYRNPNALPRAWLVHAVETLPDDLQQLDRLAAPDFDPAKLAIASQTVPDVAQPSASEPIPEISYAPNRASVRANPSAAALLVVSDAYNEDWHVTVDGKPAPLYRANYALRGVWLPAGEHTIEFVYQPRSFIIGGAISLAALVVIVAAVVVSRSRKPKARSQIISQ